MIAPPDLVHRLMGICGTPTEIFSCVLRSCRGRTMAEISTASVTAARLLREAQGNAEQVDALERLGRMTSGAYHG